jgi:ABC-type tungstate transport system substrate-binding protein
MLNALMGLPSVVVGLVVYCRCPRPALGGWAFFTLPRW